MTIEEKAKRYDEALERCRKLYNEAKANEYTSGIEDYETIFPELAESEDERIRKTLITFFQRFPYDNIDSAGTNAKEAIAWLEKQGETTETINMDKFAQGVLRGTAIHLITWIDYNAAEGNMCLSNMECKDIENALVNADWNRIYAYMKKKLEKQGEQKVTYTTTMETGDGGINALVTRELPTAD